MFTPVLSAIRFSPFSIHFLFFSYYKVSGLQDKKMVLMTKGETLWKVLCPPRFKRSAPATEERIGLERALSLEDLRLLLMWRIIKDCFKVSTTSYWWFRREDKPVQKGLCRLAAWGSIYQDTASILRVFTRPWTMKQNSTPKNWYPPDCLLADASNETIISWYLRPKQRNLWR
jgi:hypothetical protein